MAFRAATHSYTSVPNTVVPVPAAPSLSPPLLDGSSTASWETLRKQARQLENEIESKLVQYSKLGSGAAAGAFTGGGGGPGSSAGQRNAGGSKSAELELEHLLEKLTSVVNMMTQGLDNVPATAPTNPSMMHMLQRHRDILYDYSKEFKRTKANIAAAREHAELLNSVRDDISSFRSGAGMDTQDYLLTERGKIDASHRLTDEVLQQAYNMRSELHDQRDVLYGTRGRMGVVLGRFPLVNDLISRISTRKKRDSLIMAGVISACVCLLLWYWLSRF